MNEDEKPAAGDARTPGRRAREESAWGRSDLARRVARLPIPEESRARVARFVADEVERARAAWRLESAPLAGLACPRCEKPIEDDLRQARRDEALVARLQELGAADLTPEELEKLLSDSAAASPRAGSR